MLHKTVRIDTSKMNALSNVDFQFCFIAKLQICDCTECSHEPRGLLLVGAVNTHDKVSKNLNPTRNLHKEGSESLDAQQARFFIPPIPIEMTGF